MKFISNKNMYEFDSFHLQDSLIALYIDNQYCVFEYTGDVKFLQEQLTEIKDEELKPTNVAIAKTEARIQEEVKVDPDSIPDFI